MDSSTMLDSFSPKRRRMSSDPERHGPPGGFQLDDVRADIGPPRERNDEVRSSWLRKLEVFSLSKCSRKEKHDPDNCSGLLKDEIKSLSLQLVLVKERLGPASEKCAASREAVSQHSLPNGSTPSVVATSSNREFCKARRACNPFEVLGEGQGRGLNKIFMNRSAIKLANIDALLHWVLTTTKPNQDSSSSFFRFVDLCGAPGGFSEYLFRRCFLQNVPASCGYGMSLIGRNEHGRGLDWRLEPFSSVEKGRYASFQVFDGVDGTGDIFNWSNVERFKAFVDSDHCHSAHSGVDLVVADGGMDAQRDADYQEQITLKLVVCQTTAALTLLRPGGTFLIKMFGWQTPAIRLMMYDLVNMFDSMVALKPISSRPASAERYVVFIGFRGCPMGWMGPQWQSRIFLGDASATTLSKDVTARLNLYLDEFDRDMLALNLQACHSILSYLECQSVVDTVWKDPAASEGDDDSSSLVDVNAYRQAWQLW